MSAMNCDRRLLALTLWPEWAWAIFRLNERMANCAWAPDRRLQPGDWLAIHAGASAEGTPGRPAALEGLLSEMIGSREIARSSIVGLARYDGWDHDYRTGWDDEGLHHWRFGEVKTLPSPVPCKGRQGLWRIEGATLERVLAQVGGA